jgi:hypothetical protein
MEVIIGFTKGFVSGVVLGAIWIWIMEFFGKY